MSITAMKTALSVLEKLSSAKLVDGTYADKDCKITFSITALRTAIQEAGAQPAPKQEFIQPGYQLVPVEPTDKMVQASLHLDLSYMPLQEGYDRAAVYKAMLAAAPVQAQPAKPLTNSEIDEAIQQHVDPVATYRNLHEFARAIEAKVKEQS